MKILLLDMDGTLLAPHGYHFSLQETVAITGQQLGYADVHLTHMDITAFETAGVSSEWDSAAICAAILLENVMLENPKFTPPPSLSLQFPTSHSNPPPKFRSFANLLADAALQHLPPLLRAKRLLLNKAKERTSKQNQALINILETARQMEGSFTHRIFQELVLGSEKFERTYNLPPMLNVESYLLTHDRSNFNLETRNNLKTWLQNENHHAIIYTGRPSRSPAKKWSVPEAELGAQCVGLEALPIAGWGGILWLSAQRDCDPLMLLKPAPTHALIGLQLAIGESLETALTKAAEIVFEHSVDRSWESLQGALVYVFEDTAPGITSLFHAQQILLDVGIHISVFPIGVTDKDSKRRALETVGASVFEDFSEAFAHSLSLDC